MVRHEWRLDSWNWIGEYVTCDYDDDNDENLCFCLDWEIRVSILAK
jgi:hypothetical protein